MTERHRKYLILASLFGVIIGMFAGLLVALLIGIIMTGFGCSIMAILEKAYKGDKWYVLWMSIGIGAIVVGLCFLIGAIIFLTLHEGGAI